MSSIKTTADSTPDPNGSFAAYADVSARPIEFASDVRADIVTEPTALSLSKIFGVLTQLDIFPSSISILPLDSELLSVQLQFARVSASKLDLLARKALQLTETLNVSVQPI